VVNHHHHLLPHVRKYANKWDTLVNIDEHSDLADRDFESSGRGRRPELECGTWVNHVNGEGKRYVWSYPHPKCYDGGEGTCHVFRNPFGKESKEVAGWSETVALLKYRHHPRYKVAAIGIALSEPDYTDPNIVDAFYTWIGETKPLGWKLHKSVKPKIRNIRWDVFNGSSRSMEAIAQFAVGELSFRALEDWFQPYMKIQAAEVRKMRDKGVSSMRRQAKRYFTLSEGQTPKQAGY
jgi:hypothetical protein